MNSRAKGKRGELELAHHLTDAGFPARRGQQYAGGTDSPDIICPGLREWHIECKRVEAGNLYHWLKQAKKDAKRKKALVIHRKSGQEWVAILSLSDFLALMLMVGLP